MAPPSAPITALIIGYGNELRRDDGIGPYVARRMAARRLSGVRTLVVPQLTPELADDLSAVRVAIFVDAHTAPHSEGIEIRRLERGHAPSSITHVCPPATLVELARAAFGAAPEAWLVAIAGEDFDAGEGLSCGGKTRADSAVERIERLLCELV